MHKKVPCPHCKGKGVVLHPTVLIHPYFHIEESVRTCPNCKGGRHYLKPVTNKDILMISPEDQSMEALARVAVDAVSESLIECHGAVLNEPQKEYLKKSIHDKFMKFLSSDEIDLKELSTAALDMSEFVLSLEDILNLGGTK